MAVNEGELVHLASPVLVTGFGPFLHHPVNASWAAVQELEKIGLQNSKLRSAVPLVTREIPVAYSGVSQNIPKLLKEVSPQLCVHVGVSPYNAVKMERYGRNRPYLVADIYGESPDGFTCIAGGPECLQTTFDLDKVLEKVSGKQADVQFDVSSDAGRYLCDFIYYTSLHVNSTPVLFVHVPELGKPYTVHQIANALKTIIEVLLDEIHAK